MSEEKPLRIIEQLHREFNSFVDRCIIDIYKDLTGQEYQGGIHRIIPELQELNFSITYIHNGINFLIDDESIAKAYYTFDNDKVTFRYEKYDSLQSKNE